jgi:hypothetical protein
VMLSPKKLEIKKYEICERAEKTKQCHEIEPNPMIYMREIILCFEMNLKYVLSKENYIF